MFELHLFYRQGSIVKTYKAVKLKQKPITQTVIACIYRYFRDHITGKTYPKVKNGQKFKLKTGKIPAHAGIVTETAIS